MARMVTNGSPDGGREPVIGELIGDRQRLDVWCGDCPRQVSIDAAEAVRLLGANTTYRQARAMLKCSACGAKNGGGFWPIDARPNWGDFYDRLAAEGHGAAQARASAALALGRPEHDAAPPVVPVETRVAGGGAGAPVAGPGRGSGRGAGRGPPSGA